jgi:hypothetical protein
MKSEGGGRQPDAFSDRAGGQSLRPALDQLSVDRQTMLVRQSAQGVDDLPDLHDQYDITNIMEMSMR